MEQKRHMILSAFLLLVLGLFFGIILFSYVTPMDDVFLDLSTTAAQEHIATEVADKGWTVFTQDGETRTELEPTGTGAFRGIKLGQTFYYSRVMSEELDSPTLQLGTANRMFSVWLDDTLLYTDCPELDNRVGYLTLPMSEWDRSEPITLSLPRDYVGKTLTIAQSFPSYSEGGSPMAFPASVKLYCGYSYESGLISESYRTAFLAITLFIFAVLLMLSFLHRQDWGVLCIALAVFAWMAHVIVNTSYYFTYFGMNWSRFTQLPLSVASGTLLCFLFLRATKWRRPLALIPAAYGLFFLISLGLIIWYPYDPSRLHTLMIQAAPQWIAWIGLTATLVLGALFWRKDSRFYRLFVPLSLIGIFCTWIVAFLNGEDVGLQILVGFRSTSISYVYFKQLYPMLIAALIAALIEALRAELERRTERQMIEQQQELALASYDHMRSQHDEIMMLRHDMMNHFHVLHSMSHDEAISTYLNNLIGQNQKIRPVVQSQNKTLNIILNSRLSTASNQGIAVDILRAEAPQSLPISDADLCSLILNIIDNAITAAANAQAPSIKIDFHVKQGFFAFSCENSVSTQAAPRTKKETVQKHGFGLRIIRSLTEQHGGLAEIKQSETTFITRIVLPLL